RRAAARAAGQRGRPADQRGRVDPLRVGHPRRARDRGRAGRGGPPLGRPAARAVAARVGARGAVLRNDQRPGRGRVRRGAGAGARTDRVTGGWMSTVTEFDARIARVAEELGERGLDALVVSAPVDVRYLTAFTGSNGAALLRASGTGHRFFTDFRYR